jgi:hypothetical protein
MVRHTGSRFVVVEKEHRFYGGGQEKTSPLVLILSRSSWLYDPRSMTPAGSGKQREAIGFRENVF